MTDKIAKKKLTTDINKALTKGFNIDTSLDETMLKNSNYNWDKLTELKDELGKSIIEFIMEVNNIINNPEIINNLGDKTEHFNKVIMVFFSDIDEFSKKISEVRKQHDGLTGPVTDMKDLDKYNNIVITYQYLFTELANLLTPTLSDIMLTISEVSTKTSVEDTKESSGE